jgi:hypothetical protein
VSKFLDSHPSYAKKAIEDIEKETLLHYRNGGKRSEII